MLLLYCILRCQIRLSDRASHIQKPVCPPSQTLVVMREAGAPALRHVLLCVEFLTQEIGTQNNAGKNQLHTCQLGRLWAGQWAGWASWARPFLELCRLWVGVPTGCEGFIVSRQSFFYFKTCRPAAQVQQ